MIAQEQPRDDALQETEEYTTIRVRRADLITMRGFKTHPKDNDADAFSLTIKAAVKNGQTN